MPGPNLVSGARIRVGSASTAEPATRSPRFATSGTDTSVLVTSPTSTWSGTAVCLGSPPVVIDDGTIRLLLVGEIYNGDRIAAALRHGTEHDGDAALVLAAWRHWGAGAFRALNGRYAVVLEDGHSGEVVIATDHAGSVPLWIRADEQGVDVSTELKVLSGVPGASVLVAGAECLPGLSGAHRVPAATVLVMHGVGKGKPVSRPLRTWLPPMSRRLMDEDAAVAEVGVRLSEAVRGRVRDDPKPTVVLSGGIDSSGVAAHVAARTGRLFSVSMGTDISDEFSAAASVARHLRTDHQELTVPSADLVRELPWVVWAAEITDHSILEYLLPLVSLYRRLEPGPRRLLTGYGADIPLGGMHRLTERLSSLDAVISDDMATFDGLNEMSPVLSGIAGIWSTHPYWDKDLLDVLVGLEAGLKRRYGRDKWVLRQSLAGLLPAETVARPKLGIHEGSGTTSAWTAALVAEGVPGNRVDEIKEAMTARMYEMVVKGREHPADVSFDDVLHDLHHGWKTQRGLTTP